MTHECAIIPIREFSNTKLRLRYVLSRDQRSELSIALISRVVSTLELSKIKSVIVVASNRDEAYSNIGELSPKVRVIKESARHGGVNSAMNDGIQLAQNEGASTFVLLPSDLPIINHSKIDEAVELLKDFDLIINPAEKKDGTNLLAYASEIKFSLHYDDDSYSKHLNQALKEGLSFRSLDWSEFSVDLDTEEDLKRAMKLHHVVEFKDLIWKIKYSAL